MLVWSFCLPAWPLGDLGFLCNLPSVVAVSTSAKAKVREREGVPSPSATVGPGDTSFKISMQTQLCWSYLGTALCNGDMGTFRREQPGAIKYDK